MPTDGLLEESEGHNWKHVKNLDKFFNGMYEYYVAKGIGAIILSQFCAVVTLGFTIGFSVFLLGFVDWNALLQCHDEETCSGVHNSLVVNPFHETPTMFSFFIFLYFVHIGSKHNIGCFGDVQLLS